MTLGAEKALVAPPNPRIQLCRFVWSKQSCCCFPSRDKTVVVCLIIYTSEQKDTYLVKSNIFFFDENIWFRVSVLKKKYLHKKTGNSRTISIIC